MSCMSSIATEFDGTVDTMARIRMYREVNEQKFPIQALQLPCHMQIGSYARGG